MLLVAAVLIMVVLAPTAWKRIRMETRARDLLSQIEHPETISVFVSFDSALRAKRLARIDEEVTKMEPAGWQFLRLRAAPIRRTSRFWGGGLSIDFVRQCPLSG
jgi:hypothetical protein